MIVRKKRGEGKFSFKSERRNLESGDRKEEHVKTVFEYHNTFKKQGVKK